MKKMTALFLSFWLLGALSGPARAEELPPCALTVLQATEDAEPEEDAAPREPLPTPTPSPAPDALDALLGQNPIDYEVDLAAYYLGEMTAAAEAGDVKAGRAAEASRAAALAAGGKGEEIAFDDLYLLARIIDSAAGSDWLTDEFRMCVGEVVLNRVASPEFPDTIQGVVYQKGQYSVVNTARFAAMAPRCECVDAALRLLQGERHMVPGVVYQADYLQGELFSVYFDRRLGNTYFCLSENLDLYP